MLRLTQEWLFFNRAIPSLFLSLFSATEVQFFTILRIGKGSHLDSPYLIDKKMPEIDDIYHKPRFEHGAPPGFEPGQLGQNAPSPLPPQEWSLKSF